MVHHTRTTCRGCGGGGLRHFLSLGQQPLANAFLASTDEFEDEAFYPLDVYFCETCSLVQLVDVVDPEVLFRNYIYVTGTSDTIAAHNRAYAATVSKRLALGSDDLVVEVASNDGSLLKCFAGHGVRTLGVEPATNIAEIARAAGIDTTNEFFNHETAESLQQRCGPARAVIGNNVLAHVDDTRDFLEGCRALVADDGLVIVEVPYVGELLERLEYDTIYHEHLCYFSATALTHVFASAGLTVTDIERVPVHGGSVRVYAAPSGNGAAPGNSVDELIEREAGEGFRDLETYRRFAAGVESNRQAVRNCLEFLRNDGRSVAGYGAPAKGNTLLNYCSIDRSLMAYTVDKSDLKVGRFTPGMHIPVLPSTELLSRRPDYTMILAWNFADEIMRQQREYHEQGGRFILPIPEPQIQDGP